MKIEPIEYDVDGQRVKGQFYEPSGEPRHQALLLLHGWTGSINQPAATKLAEQGYYVLTISMRGHGSSEGDIKAVTALDSLADAKTAYDLLRQHIPDDTAIFAVGNSYGSYISILLTAERQIGGLSLRVPANYPNEGFDQPKWGRGHDDPEVDTWRHRVMRPNENRALSLLHDFAGPIQIIEAGKDTVIPHQTVLNYVAAVAIEDQLEYVRMPNWRHSLDHYKAENDEFVAVLTAWLTKQV